jgi:flagellar M-ring protein FliF
MNEWFKKVFAQIKTLWGKWSVAQRGILISIVAAVVIAVVVMLRVSAAPTMVPVIDAPITNEDTRNAIITRINQENIRTQVSSSGVIMVADDATARRMRSILIREDLIPSGTDPWAIFDVQRWTLTDFERNVNLQRAITQMVTEHIKALDDVDDAHVTIVQPETTLFTADQDPVTASVIITPRPGSDISTNRTKIEGIQKILKFAIQGLTDSNIVIADQSGTMLNDFEGMAGLDRLSLIERETKIVQTLEAQYRAKILKALQETYGADRVRDLNIKIDMDMSQKTVQSTEVLPVILKERTPGLAYDDSRYVESITVSESVSSTTWTGTGFTPEGPAGVEGQTAPVMQDMSNLVGEVTQTTREHNEALNQRTTQEERSPTIDRVTVSVNIDGTWTRKYDEKGKQVITPNGSIEREYTAISPADIQATGALIQNAIGYDVARGDSVTVQNIRFDRTAQFTQEDALIFKEKQIQTAIIIFIGGLVLLFLAFILFRVISRERERLRRKREDEMAMAAQHQREMELLNAEREENVPDNLSPEEARRKMLMDDIVSMAKDRPTDVAQLIRTWLVEE